VNSGGLITQSVRSPVSPDAVIVIPGIMGSALCQGDRELWGLERLGWYGRAWRWQRSSLRELALNADERRGDYGRVQPNGLLRFPAYTPFLQGFEPYTALTRAIERVVAHPAAVLGFAYDWRLPVAYNAGLLATAAREHLGRWHTHPQYLAMRRDLPDTRPGRLVLVAHSMGGLLARALPDGLDVRATVTLGAPFDGAAKCALMLATGAGAPIPLPRVRLRDAARTMPGVHDLLPTYRCVDDIDGDTDPRQLTPADVAGFGGDAELAQRSFDFYLETSQRALPGEHVVVVGNNQPTLASLTLSAGSVAGQHYTFRVTNGEFERDSNGVLRRFSTGDAEGGDGTVPLNSALPSGGRPSYLPQQHGAIAVSPESIGTVCEVIAGRDPYGERLGGGELGIHLPDIVPAGSEVAFAVTGVDGPVDASVTIEDEDGVIVEEPTLHYAAGVWRVETVFPRPGVYRVTVAGSGTSPVVQYTLADEL
jgi:hypothetical protein